MKVVAKNSGKDFSLSRFAFNFFNIGLIFLDNIHFQYNSMMYGLMIFAIAYIQEVTQFIHNPLFRNHILKVLSSMQSSWTSNTSICILLHALESSIWRKYSSVNQGVDSRS